MSVKTARIVYILIIAAVIFIPLVFFGTGFFVSASQKVLPGIEIMGVDLEGLNREQGIQRLTELEKNLRGTRVVLRFQDRRWPLLLDEVGLNLDEEAVINAALSVGRQGSLVRRWQERKELRETGLSISPVIELDRERLAMRVKELTRDITVEPQDAALKINSDDTVSVVPGKDGIGVDINRLEKDIFSFLLNVKRPEVVLFLVPVAPARSTELVESMGVNGVLASYTTSFDPSKISRVYNINVAARALDELMVGPGEEISFNKVVGPRSSEAGYKTAPVIINNEFVDGLGGGVCQVSTTLYNSVLLANLEIVERTNHSLPISYVPVGRDATVVYDAIDFKFRNNTGNYLYIKTYVYSNHITVKICGNTAYKRDVIINSWMGQEETDPRVVYENDPTLPKGEQVVKQEGSKGFKAYAERVVMLNGVVEKREMLPASDYSPLNKIILLGTMERVLPKAPSATQPPEAGQQRTPPANSQVTPGNPGQPSQATGGAAPGGGGGSQGTSGNVLNNGPNPAIPGTKPAGTDGNSAGNIVQNGNNPSPGQGGSQSTPSPQTGTAN